MKRFSWIRKLFSSPRPIRNAPRRARPVVEALEDRIVPATIKVTTFADVVANDSLISLREAINQAATNPGDDQIQLPAGEYDLSQGQLSINDATGAVAIKGLGSGATIDAQGASGVLAIASGSTAE